MRHMKQGLHLCLMLILFGSLAALRASAGVEAEAEEGVVTGILTEKGKTWIEVKPDGESERRRFFPFWRGGMPKDGGGFDTATLEGFKNLFGGNRLRVAWRFEERARIVSVEMIVPKEKSGAVTGVVIDRGDAWMEVKPDGAGPAERYTPHWIGGMPDDGGGLDKKMLEAISAVRVGDRIRVRWEYEERKRAVEIKRVAPQKGAR